MNELYFDIKKLKESFSFLIEDYAFKVLEEGDSNSGPSLDLIKKDLIINLYFDFRDYFFYFKLINGRNTQYPNDKDFTNIKTFHDLIKRFEPDFNLSLLNPDDEKGFKDALDLNVKFLKKYVDKIPTDGNWNELWDISSDSN